MANTRPPEKSNGKVEVSSAHPIIAVFCSYAHRDEKLRNELDKHLAPLRRNRKIAVWTDRQIAPGIDFANEIDFRLLTSHIILLLISPDFLASDYCYGREMDLAVDRHAAGLTRVIPVILRPCDWHSSPIRHLLVLPKDGKPVTSWPKRDEALFNVAMGVRKVVDELNSTSAVLPQTDSTQQVSGKTVRD